MFNFQKLSVFQIVPILTVILGANKPGLPDFFRQYSLTHSIFAKICRRKEIKSVKNLNCNFRKIPQNVPRRVLWWEKVDKQVGIVALTFKLKF